MNEFNPGDGWREVPPEDRRAEVQWYGNPAGLDPVKAWVRVPPVPPLPTEPYTVIRVTWRDPEYLTGSHIYFLASDEYWVPQNRNAPITDRVDLQPRITGFEVLAEPVSEDGKQWHNTMRETASDVLDRVRATPLWQTLLAVNPANGAELDAIARDFGVES